MEKKSNKSPFLVEGWHFPGKENKQLGPVRGRVSVCSVYNERSLARPQHAILDVTVSLSEWVPGLRTCSWSPLHPLPPPSPPPPPRCWPSMWSPACSLSSSWSSSWPSWTSWRCLCPSWWWRCWAAPAAGWGRPPSSPSAPPTMRTSRGHEVAPVRGCAHLLCGVTQQGEAPLDTLTGLAETSVQEGLVLGHLQHWHLRLAHSLLSLLRHRLVLLHRVLQDGDLLVELLNPRLYFIMTW